MDSLTEREKLRIMFGDDYVDVTEGVTCYENGKVLECECGHGIGVELDEAAVECASCGRMVVDKEAKEREPPDREDSQTGLNQWT